VPRRRARRAALAPSFLFLCAAMAAGSGRGLASAGPLSAEQHAAVEAVAACARPDGGWTYVCDPPSGPHGVVTSILIRARAIGERLGTEDWDVLVLRSPGTPAAGLVLLDAWSRDGDPRWLATARRAGDLLLAAQLPSGGWASEMPVRGAGLAWWFRWANLWTALDDDVTSGGARLLLALWRATGAPAFRDGALRALDLLLAAQRRDGSWPLTWRPRWAAWLAPNFEDLPSTNDAATAAPIATLLAAAETLGDARYLAAARRGGQWLLAAQGAPPQAAWAQQYDAAGRPGSARRFEPAGYAAWESREMLDALLQLARSTGELRWCSAVPGAVAWFLGSALAPGCWARLQAPGESVPLFADRAGHRVATAALAKHPYKWTGDYGIPGLLAELGLGADGAPLDPSAPRAPRRIYGDAGACPGGLAVEDTVEDPDEPHPRARIVRAAVLLSRGAPISLSPCASVAAEVPPAAATEAGPRAGASAVLPSDPR
jgi:Pectic acid lyase